VSFGTYSGTVKEEGMEWINVALYRDMWRALVLLVRENAGIS
jgi:hypothetical protein